MGSVPIVPLGDRQVSRNFCTRHPYHKVTTVDWPPRESEGIDSPRFDSREPWMWAVFVPGGFSLLDIGLHGRNAN